MPIDCRLEIDERLQYETTCMQTTMGNPQIGCIDYLVAVQEQIEIDGARPVGEGRGFVQIVFDCLQDVMNVFCRLIGVDVSHGIKEVLLIGEAHGSRAVDRGETDSGPRTTKRVGRCAEIVVRIDVRAEGDVNRGDEEIVGDVPLR